MTDITNQEKRTAIEVSEAIERGDYPMADMWPIMARVILATVEAPPKSLAEEVKEAMMFRVNDTDAEGCHHAIDLSDRVEALERGRDHWKCKYDETHAKVERLTAERDTNTETHSDTETHTETHSDNAVTDPADVKPGEAWIVEFYGEKRTALKDGDDITPWNMVTTGGWISCVRNEDVNLITRLVPTPRTITDPDPDYF